MDSERIYFVIKYLMQVMQDLDLELLMASLPHGVKQKRINSQAKQTNRKRHSRYKSSAAGLKKLFSKRNSPIGLKKNTQHNIYKKYLIKNIL